jgi:hypothetical protein
VLSLLEDGVYVGHGTLLAICAITLLLAALRSVAHSLWTHALAGQIAEILDQILLVLLIIELLDTVPVSFRSMD